MATYHYELSIEAATEKEADSKLRSLSALASRLNIKELEKLAYIVKHDPAKLAMAKKALGV